MYRRAGQSLERLRQLDDLLVRSQRLPKLTRVSPVAEEGVAGEWIQASGAGTGAVLLYLHGGAFVAGSPATHRELAARISGSGGGRVFSAEYRLSPEHPFPAAILDVVAAYRWLQDSGYSPSDVVLGGDSSGGGLALQALLAMKEQGLDLPKAAFFLSPVTDWRALDGDSYVTRARQDPLLTRAQCRFTAALYAGEHLDQSPLLKPLEMDLAGLPPMWIHVGDSEILLSDAERLARGAVEAGVEVELKVWTGLWHVFQTAARLVPEARESLEDLGRFIRKHLGGVGGTNRV